MAVFGSSWVFSKYTIKELAVPCVPSTLPQTESNEITPMTHGTFIEGSFHLEVFTLFESMPSSEPLHHQYVDVLFVPAVTVTSGLRI